MAHPDSYPNKSVSERALGPSDLDALRTALLDDLRSLTHKSGFPAARVETPQAWLNGVGAGPPLPYNTGPRSQTPLDGLALVLCDQVRLAHTHLDTLEHGPAPMALAGASEPPPGLRARLEQAQSLLESLTLRLAALLDQIGVI